jgi:hypothetical protein
MFKLFWKISQSKEQQQHVSTTKLLIRSVSPDYHDWLGLLIPCESMGQHVNPSNLKKPQHNSRFLWRSNTSSWWNLMIKSKFWLVKQLPCLMVTKTNREQIRPRSWAKVIFYLHRQWLTHQILPIKKTNN